MGVLAAPLADDGILAGSRGPLRQPLESVQISPELVLVCPELREWALARLPERDPDGFLPRPAPPAPRERPRLRVVAPPVLRDEPPQAEAAKAIPTVEEPEQPAGLGDPAALAGAVAAQVLASFSQTAVFGAKAVAATAGLVMLAELVH